MKVFILVNTQTNVIEFMSEVNNLSTYLLDLDSMPENVVIEGMKSWYVFENGNIVQKYEPQEVPLEIQVQTLENELLIAEGVI